MRAGDGVMPESETTTETTTETTGETRDASTEETPENLLKALKAERDARKALEKELKPLKTYKEQQEQARLTETEKLQAREKAVADQEARITQRLRASVLRDEISTAVAAEKIMLNAPVGDVMRLIDTEAIEWDGETPANIRALLRDLVKTRPYLASRRAGSADGGTGGGADMGANDMNARIRAAARRG